VKTGNCILSVHVRRSVDPDPDLSWLGEYGSTPRGEHVIDRQERGDMGRHQYRFFVPALTAEQTGNRDSPEQDYARMEGYNRGDWGMIGIWAEAEVQTHNLGVIQIIRSGGLWGVESDSGREYLASVEQEELAALREELEALGFTKRQCKAALANLQREVTA
jgi:hypothetical protein